MILSAYHRRVYDHRIRALICKTGNPYLFPELRIPRSTAAGWIARGTRAVVSVDVLDKTEFELQSEVLKLRRRVRVLTGVVRLLLALVRVSGFRLDGCRLPDGNAKAVLLSAVDGARKVLPLGAVLRVLRLSVARYYAWKRTEVRCALSDRSSCPRTSPTQLTADEVTTIREMTTSEEYRHMPLRTLAIYTQRAGKVFASVSTWFKLVRE